jgi:sugar transferase (PEP-CTERM system associated)
VKIFAHYIAPQVVLFGITDFVLACASAYVAYFVLLAVDFNNPGIGGWHLLLRAVVFAALVIAGLGAMGLYSIQQRYRTEGILARMLIGVTLSAAGFAALEFLFGFVMSRLHWGLSFLICLPLLAVGRLIASRFIDDEVFRRRVLVYGAGQRASRLLELRRRSDQRNFRIAVFVPAPGDKLVIEDRRVIGEEVPSLYACARDHEVTEIVIAVDDRRRSFPVAELLKSKFSGIRVVDLLEFLERETGRVKVDLVNPSWLIFSGGFDRITRSGFAFRALDLLAATAIFIVTLPIMVLVALAILIDDGRPSLYRQRRVGLNGEEFTLYKFRSMRKDAEAAGSPVWADKQDSRVTRVGRFLRKFRLDELPQLINVFRNEMSFVGPRPERPEFVEQLAAKIPYYHERHYVKPGLTGWAQLSYPYGASEQDALAKLEYDIYYIKNRSVIFNLMILLQTAEVVLWQKGSR